MRSHTLRIKNTLRFIAACLAVCLVLVSPCHARKKAAVLVHMTEAQRSYLANEVVRPFAKTNRTSIAVLDVPDMDSIAAHLTRHKNKILLVKIPFITCWSMVRSGELQDINGFLSAEELAAFNAAYILTWFGEKRGRQFFLPRKYETRVMVYRKSKVRDAVGKWASYRDTIEALLKPVNGYGLPRGYDLESDPDEWDYFDLFVAGFTWSQLAYDGATGARIAHRSKRYSGTALRVVDRIYQCGGDSLTMLRMHGDPVTDAFTWEAFYTYAGIYNEQMLREEWGGREIWEGFAAKEVFLSFMTQIDCFHLFGTGADGLNGYVGDKEDIGVALMPAGCSIDLDPTGVPLRRGTKAITTGGWWWGIPADCPNPRLAYRLFLHITSRENQLRECVRFGMIPVRDDILKSNKILHGEAWRSGVFQTSYRQIQLNDNNILPTIPRLDGIVDVYLDAWVDIVAEKNWSENNGPPDRAFIAARIIEKHATRIGALLK